MHSFPFGAACVAALALISVPVQAQEPTDAPAPLPAAVLARDAYVRAVLSANPGIEVARQGWRAALARVRQAGAFDDPMLEMSMAPLSIGSSQARFGYEVGIRQQLPWFGKRSLERDVMTAEAAASASDLDSVRRELAMTALLLYDQYYLAFRSLEINAQHATLLQSLRASATAQFASGRGSAQDALQAEAELTQLEREAAILDADRDVVAAQMNELLHRDPATPLAPPVLELATHVPPRVEDAKQLEQTALAQRAEISSARLHARAETAKAAAADRDYYPSFTLSTSYSSMWDMPEHRWMVGLGINIPLPTERRAGLVDEAHAARAQYEAEIARMSDSVKTQVYVALRRVRESEHVLALYQTRLLPVARDQIDSAQAGFIASRTSFMAVVEAERNLRRAELDQKLAQAECDRRQAELERALGRIPGLDGQEKRP
jgi:cobalt-zinc-cadmium efflux system outer membrane protein